MRRLPALLLCLTCLGAAPAGAVDFRWQGRGWAGAGLDSNAPRDFVAPGTATLADGVLSGLASLEGVLLGDGFRVVGAYDGGVRKFVYLGTEDTLVQNAQVEGLYGLSRQWNVGAAGHLRDRRGADRDYSDLSAELLAEFIPDGAFSLRLSVGAHRFLFRSRFEASWSGAEGTLSGRYRFNRRHSLTFFGTFSPHAYNGLAHPNPDDATPPDPAPQRTDSFLVAGLSYTWKGPVVVTASYSYLDQASSSFGESWRRHRLSATVGAHLPWDFTLLGQAALMLARYPDGVYLSSDIQVAEDDENSSSVTLKLVHPLSERVDLEFKYALYVNRLPRNDYLYARQVFLTGLSVSF